MFGHHPRFSRGHCYLSYNNLAVCTTGDRAGYVDLKVRGAFLLRDRALLLQREGEVERYFFDM